MSLQTGICHFESIPAVYEQMRQLRANFKQFLAQKNFTSDEIHNWLVVYSEAVNNAIEHGARADPNQTIGVRWTLFNDSLELSVSDPGLGFHTTESSGLLRSHGYGLKLINSFCDHVEHSVNPAGGHTLSLSKKTLRREVNPEDAQADSSFQKIFADFYGNLGYPISAGALLEPLIEHLIARFPGVTFQLYATKDYISVAEYIFFYKGSSALESTNTKNTPYRPKQWTRIDDTYEIPLRLGQKVIGELKVLNLPAAEKTIERFLAVATCVALALENEKQQQYRRSTQEALLALKVAANLQSRQRKLSSATKECIGAVHTFEERAQSVSGDIIECAQSPDGGHYMLIADVMGKGVAAAFLSGIFRGGWHLLCQRESHPLVLLKELNAFLYDELNGQPMFVTAALAHLTPDGRTLSLVNAGHTPVYLQAQDGRLTAIESSGPPLGLFAEPYYQISCHATQDFHRLYMPTDGVYCWGEDIEHFDYKKLEKIFVECQALSVKEIWEQLQTLRDQAAQKQIDDQALLVWESPSCSANRTAKAAKSSSSPAKSKEPKKFLSLL